MIRKAVIVSFVPFLFTLTQESGTYHSFETKMVVNLRFPYEKGYESFLTGTFTEFDSYNFPKKISPCSIHYKFTGDKSGITQITVTDVRNTDTTVYKNTYLGINDKGMHWWINDKETGVKDNHKTVAISLPLFRGKTWKTYLNDQRVEARCITVDTTIETPAGKFSAFGIEMVAETGNNKSYKQYLLIREYYNQEMGKIAYFQQHYAVMKESGEIFRLKEKEYKFTGNNNTGAAVFSK